MNYHQLLSEVKTTIIESLSKKIPAEAYNSNPNLSKLSYMDIIYSDIMALGYNKANLKKATEDLFEMKSALNNSPDLKNQLKKGLEETLEKYPDEVTAFKLFHEQSQGGVSFQQVLSNVKKELA